MNLLDQAAALARFGRWGLALARHDTRCASPVPDNPKFISPRDAVRRIPDGAVVAGVGARRAPAGLDPLLGAARGFARPAIRAASRW